MLYFRRYSHIEHCGRNKQDFGRRIVYFESTTIVSLSRNTLWTRPRRRVRSVVFVAACVNHAQSDTALFRRRLNVYLGREICEILLGVSRIFSFEVVCISWQLYVSLEVTHKKIFIMIVKGISIIHKISYHSSYLAWTRGVTVFFLYLQPQVRPRSKASWKN